MSGNEIVMANKGTRRVNLRSDEFRPRRFEFYEDGNAVRKIAAEPEEDLGQPQKKKSAAPRVSGQTRKNRARARSMSVGYVLFLSAVCVATLFICINYLQLRYRLTAKNETITVMETTLDKLKADNDAYYKQIEASVSLDEIRETALTRLGMHYPEESQIRYYNSNEGSYVRQYASVPSGD